MGPKSNDRHPYKREKGADSERRPRGDEGSEWINMATEDSWSHQKPEGQEAECPLDSSEGAWPRPTT